MKSIVSLAGMGVTGILFYGAWQLCADNAPYWWTFLIVGALSFIISAAVACAPPTQKEEGEDDI